jgi:hypothetical protein
MITCGLRESCDLRKRREIKFDLLKEGKGGRRGNGEGNGVRDGSAGGNGVHPAAKVGEHGHPQTAQDVPQGQSTKNSISNGPHELRRQLDHRGRGNGVRSVHLTNRRRAQKALRIEGSGPWYRVVNLTRFPIFGSSGD